MASITLGQSLVFAGESQLVLKSNSNLIDIQDGNRLLRKIWAINPTLEIDAYDALKSDKPKKVTFISDIDSISFDVIPGKTYDFNILLNGKQLCATRIVSNPMGLKRVGTNLKRNSVVIPMVIKNDKLHIKVKINGSQELNAIWDTGANGNVIYPSAIRKGVKLEFDGSTLNRGTGGTTKRQTSSKNSLEFGGFKWSDEAFILVEKQTDEDDVVIGYPVFSDKVVELDYDRMLMIIHDKTPSYSTTFSKTALVYLDGLTSVEVRLEHGKATAIGQFDLDTGGNGTLSVTSTFANEEKLQGTMKLLGKSQSTGVGSGILFNEILMLPKLSIAGYTLQNIPIHVELPPTTEPTNTTHERLTGGKLEMNVLRRFNTIIDYPRNEIYFKPIRGFDAGFPRP